jgi:tetratricopeptide (TPR) repeat protein
MLPLWKQLLFGALALAIFFAGMEGALTLAGVKPLVVTEDPFVGFAGNIPLFEEHVLQEGTVRLVTASNKLTTFNLQYFPKEKGDRTYRIFCMGGSTTYGHPYRDPQSFCGWLLEFLRAADPSVNWEVINAGGISYASYRVANLMDELSRYQPDLFIVYSGQNEFLEERTYRNIKDIPGWVRGATGVLARSRTYTVMHRTLNAAKRKVSRPAGGERVLPAEVKEILNQTVGPTSYRRDDTLQNQIIDHYRFNLRRMVAIARGSGSRIMFVTPASIMRDLPPFKSEHRAGITAVDQGRWESLYRQGVKLQEAGNAAGALAQFAEALRLDNRHANLHFRMGEALFALKRFDEAKRSFQAAIDEDICPLRILSPMSQAVRAVAAESGVPLVDFVKLIDEDSARRYGHAIPGDEYFVDHVHPTLEATRMLALSLLDHLVREGIARPAPHWNDAAIAAVSRKVEQSITPQEKALALWTLAKTIDWSGRLDKSHNLLLQAAELQEGDKGALFLELANSSVRIGDSGKAIEYYRKALEFRPDDAVAHSRLAFYLRTSGKPQDALRHYQEILRIDRAAKHGTNSAAKPVPAEYLVNAHIQMASLDSAQGKVEEALAHYAEAIRLKPGDDGLHVSRGALLAGIGRVDEAARHYAEALKINPNSAKAHNNLGIILEQQGNGAEALRHYAEALRIEPDSVQAHNNLGVAHAKQGEIDKAVSLFSKALKIDPHHADAHYNLGMALALQNRRDESRFHFAEAERLRASTATPTRKPGARER